MLCALKAIALGIPETQTHWSSNQTGLCAATGDNSWGQEGLLQAEGFRGPSMCVAALPPVLQQKSDSKSSPEVLVMSQVWGTLS